MTQRERHFAGRVPLFVFSLRLITDWTVVLTFLATPSSFAVNFRSPPPESSVDRSASYRSARTRHAAPLLVEGCASIPQQPIQAGALSQPPGLQDLIDRRADGRGVDDLAA